MTPHIDIPRVQEALYLLNKISAEAQLLHLKNLCVNNGTWSVPENHRDYSPVLHEITLFGVPAVTNEIEALPRCWMLAANNILTALTEDEAA